MTLLERLPPEAREKLGPNLTLELAAGPSERAAHPVAVRVRVQEALVHVAGVPGVRLTRTEGRTALGAVQTEALGALLAHPLVEAIELAEPAPAAPPPREEPELPIATLCAAVGQLLEKPVVRFGIVVFVVRAILKRAGAPV